MPKIIDSIAAPTSFQNSQSYVTFSFSEWSIRKFLIESTFKRTVIKKPLKMNINQKFQLTQFHFHSQGGFLTKSTSEGIIKKLIKIFQNLLFTSIYFNRDLQYHSGSKQTEIFKNIYLCRYHLLAMDFINLPNGSGLS